MKAIFNSRRINANNPLLKVTNRAFCYGDGLFETIVTGPNRINLSERHLERLKTGAEALGMSFPEDLTIENLKDWQESLKVENGVTGDYRVRIHLWRNDGGQYTPTADSSSFIVELSPNSSSLIQGNLKIGLNEEYVNTCSPISRFKTKNALKYIMLGRIREENGWDDIALLDKDQNLSESFSSSIFWIKGDQVYTPSLSTGCVSGVMRSFVIDYMAERNEPVQEVEAHMSELNSCDSIFTTNGAGLKWFSHYLDRQLVSPSKKLESLIRRLQQP